MLVLGQRHEAGTSRRMVWIVIPRVSPCTAVRVLGKNYYTNTPAALIDGTSAAGVLWRGKPVGAGQDAPPVRHDNADRLAKGTNLPRTAPESLLSAALSGLGAPTV